MKIQGDVFYHIRTYFGRFGVLNRRKREDIASYSYQYDNFLLISFT